MSAIKESILVGYPNLFTFESNKKINEQMEKYICKVKISKDQGTGFFCKIPFPDEKHMLPVLIISNHMHNSKLSNDEISIYIESEKEIKKINLNGRKYYTNEEYDTTIIEIKEKDNIQNYLELDDIIINNIINGDERNNIKYIDQTIYIIQYPEGKLSVSYGILEQIYEDKPYNFIHKCSTRKGSSGSPILNTDNKLIGIHKEGCDNYNRGSFLNYPIKEFIEQNFNTKKNNHSINNNNKINYNNLSLNDFYAKFSLNINQNSTKKIDLSDKNIGNEGLEYVAKLKLVKLKELYLDKNNLSNIKYLQNFKFDNLEILSLNNNDISNIEILGLVKFNILQTLNLCKNNISDINILEKVNFPELKQLNLSTNEIVDIKVFEKVKFPKLELLYLEKNKISDIKCLENANFKELKELLLNENNISDIQVLEKVKFPNLEVLSLGQNNISDINVLSKVNLEHLQKLFLYDNNISDITALKNIKLEKLNKLIVTGNKIDKNKNLAIISNLKSRKRLKFFDC